MGIFTLNVVGRGILNFLVARCIHSGHASLVVSVMIRKIEITNNSQGRMSRLDSYRPKPGFSPNISLATISKGMDISIPICDPLAE